MQDLKNSKTVGIDLTCLFASCPQQLQIYYINLLHSVFSQAKDFRFLLFISDLSLSAELKELFPYQNVSPAKTGEEKLSGLDLYFILDQLTVMPGRLPPLLTSPRIVPTSLFIHNFLPLSDGYLRKWPEEVSFFYRNALEMVVAAPSRIFVPGQIESMFLQQLSVPSYQTEILPLTGAVPFSFAANDARWAEIKSRLSIRKDFVVIPADIIGGLSDTLRFCRAVSADMQLIVPDLRNFITNYLPPSDRLEEDLRDVIFEPQLSYPEYLEVLYRSACVLINQNISASCCIAEASAMNVPVCMIGTDRILQGIDCIRLSAAEDLLPLLNRKPAVFGSSESAWLRLADQIIAGWQQQLKLAL